MSNHSYWIGRRVEIPVHTDGWMLGDRYGEVVKVGRQNVYVKMDQSRKVRIFGLETFELGARTI